MPEITPHLGDYKPGRVSVADGVWADPPELKDADLTNETTLCKHDFVHPFGTGERDFWGEMERLIGRMIEEELGEKPDAVRVEEPKR